MADSKITALTELTAIENDDILVIVDDPGAAPITKKATVQNVGLAIFSDKGNIAIGTAASGGTLFPVSTDGRKLVCDASSNAGVSWIDDDFSFTYIVSNPTAAVLYPGVEFGFNATLEAVRLYSGTVNGNGTIDIYKQTYANLGSSPGTADSIVGTATKPAIAGTNRYEGTAFTGWTATTFSKGDWFIPYVTGAGTIVNLSIAVSGKKTAVS
jgi:hypothetical protein